jgi:hypothetical protein
MLADRILPWEQVNQSQSKLMPHIWNNILVVTLEELVPAFYSTVGVLTATITREEKRGYGLRRAQSGGNGRQLLIDYDSLSQNVRLALGDPRKPLHILEDFYRTDAKAVDFYTNYQFENKTYIKDEARERYITNASVLGAVGRLKLAREQERLSKGGSLRGLWASLAADCTSFNSVLFQRWGVEHGLPSHEQRLQERFNAFNRHGYEVLISKAHGNQSAKKVTDDMLELLNNMFSTRKPTYEEVARQFDGFINGYIEVVNNTTGEMYDPRSFRVLSKSTIYQYLSAWENRIATHKKRSGDRQVFMQAYKPYHSLNQPTYAGSIISIDDRQPPFEYAKGKRVWFYNAIDLGSEAFTVSVYGQTKDGIIMDFYRQMVRNYHYWGVNLPDELECESSLNSSFKDTFLREGIMFQNVRIEANNARGKRIEAYYRPLRYGLEKKREGWIARPFARSESNQASDEKVPMIPYDILCNQCLNDIETWNSMPHSKFPEMTRWEYFMSKQNPNVRPTNYKAILPLLGYRTETSVKTGILKLQGKEWLLGDNSQIYFGEKLINLMKQLEGQRVDVYWLDAIDGSIIKALVYLGDKLICEAIAKPSYSRATIEQTDEDRANREAMSKYVATIEGYLNRSGKKVEQVTIIDNTTVKLNNDFKMPGRQKSVTSMPVYEEAEEMPEHDEEEIEFVPVTKTKLRDRF